MYFFWYAFIFFSMQEVLLFSLGYHQILYPLVSVSSVLGLNMHITMSDSLFWGRGVLMLRRLVPNLGFKNSTTWPSVQLNYKQTSPCSHHWAFENPVTGNKVLRALFYFVMSCWKMIRWWKKKVAPPTTYLTGSCAYMSFGKLFSSLSIIALFCRRKWCWYLYD